MKLVNFITLRMSLLTAAVLAFWSVLFYICINIEINDEMDDTLEDYAEMIMRRHLAGHKLPSHDSGSNNQYRLFEVTAAQAAARPSVMYEDRDVYIKDKRETEPARVLSYIFMDSAGRHWLVEVSMPTIDKADMKEAILYLMLALFLLICIGVIIVNYLTLNRSIKPLHRLLAWLDAYRLGSKNKPLAEGKGIMEFDKLRQAATSSMQRNEQLYAQQKFFIGHASHEMQTPIAVCQNRLELLLNDPMATPLQIEQLIKTLHTLKDMSRLNKTLLTLCRIENGQYASAQAIDISHTMSTLLQDMQMAYHNKGITVNTGGSQPLTVSLDPQLAAILCGNLLKNAFVHNMQGGTINITYSNNCLTVSNTSGTGKLDGEKIFTPFYHDAAKPSSTGLGLALVKAVCQQCGATINYSYDNGLHRFEVTFDRLPL